jgi:ATP-binding cassette subfamily F protein 3
MTQLSLSNVGVQYGATTILRDVTCTIGAGERWGLVGRNGSGKTSLFRLVTGAQAPSVGTIARTPGLRFAMLDQHREFPGATTIWEAVAEAFRSLIDLEVDLALQADALAHAGEHATKAQLDRYSRDLERFDHEGGYTYISTVDAVLEGLGFNASEARTTPLAQLSGGERGRVALARQLAIPADVLLLDEPTNHLDLETTTWLEEFLRGSRETQLIISHDRAFLDRVVDHVLHLEDETSAAYNGSYSSFVQQRIERRLSQQRAFEKQSKSIAREEDYIRRNIAGQNTKQAQGRRKRLSWMPRLTAPPDDDTAMSVRFEATERGGDQVVAFDRASVAIGERVLLHSFTEWVRRGDVVGLIGPNGTGKTTLLRTIVGVRPPTQGEIRVGGAIQTTIYTQDFANVPRDRSLYDVIADLRPTWERGAVHGHLGRVQFSGDEVKRSTSSLSGGELARLALAMMMLDGANFLIFDEPTNHLDVESIEALEDAIEAYEGTVLLVSHDRELLRKLVTRVWELRDGQIKVFDGDFAEWEEASARAASASAKRAVDAAAAQREREKEKSRQRARTEPKAKSTGRDARRELERTEAKAAELDAEVTRLMGLLADPATYEGSDSRARVDQLSRELDGAKSQLAEAMVAWEMAMEAAGG